MMVLFVKMMTLVGMVVTVNKTRNALDKAAFKRGNARINDEYSGDNGKSGAGGSCRGNKTVVMLGGRK